MFGNKLNLAAEFHFDRIKSGDRVLIVGGGTGKILSSLPPHCVVTYIDSSSQMLQKAKSVVYNGQVDFLHEDVRYWSSEDSYDAIVFPFVLDLFEDTAILSILHQTVNTLAPSGKLIVSDFYPIHQISSQRQKLILRATLMFFKLFTGHKLKDVPDIKQVVLSTKLELSSDQDIIPGMVFASMWTKPAY